MKTASIFKSAFGVCAVALLLAGCSSSSSKKDTAEAIVGTWTWSKLVINGLTINPVAGNAVPGGTTTITPQWISQVAPGTSVALTVTFNENNTVSGSLNAAIPGERPVAQAASGTWNLAGDVLTIALVIQRKTYTAAGSVDVSGRTMTLSMSNAQLLQVLGANAADVKRLNAQQQALLRGLSGTMEFTK